MNHKFFTKDPNLLCKKARNFFDQGQLEKDSPARTACLKIALALQDQAIKLTRIAVQKGKAKANSLASMLETQAEFLLKGFKDQEGAKKCQNEAEAIYDHKQEVRRILF